MLFSKLFFVASTASALATIVERDKTQDLRDLSNIDIALKDLIKTSQAYDGTEDGSNKVDGRIANLDDTFNTAANDYKKETSLPCNFTAEIVDYVNKTIESDTRTAVNNLVAIRKRFTTGLVGLTGDLLQVVKSDADRFLAQLRRLSCTTADKNAVTAAQKKIDADLDKGIKAYA